MTINIIECRTASGVRYARLIVSVEHIATDLIKGVVVEDCSGLAEESRRDADAGPRRMTASAAPDVAISTI